MAKRRSRKAKTKTRTSRRRSFKRRVRRVSRSARRYAKRRGKSIFSTVTNIIPAVAMVQLLSFNQVSGLGSNAPIGDKIKAMINGTVGSFLPFNPFSDVPQAHLHFDIEGAFNQWSGIALGSWIAGALGKKFGLPKSAMISSFGKKLLPFAIIGGAFGMKNNNDAVTNTHNPYMSGSSQTQTIVTSSYVAPRTNGGSGAL